MPLQLPSMLLKQLLRSKLLSFTFAGFDDTVVAATSATVVHVFPIAAAAASAAASVSAEVSYPYCCLSSSGSSSTAITDWFSSAVATESGVGLGVITFDCVLLLLVTACCCYCTDAVFVIKRKVIPTTTVVNCLLFYQS